jgi:hypothetical protein
MGSLPLFLATTSLRLIWELATRESE